MGISTARELYPSAPLKVVAAEVRFPFLPRVLTPAVVTAIADRIEPLLPIGAAGEMQEVSLQSGAGADISISSQVRFASPNSTTITTLSAQSLIAETTTYERYEQFRKVLSLVMASLLETAKPFGLGRVGLRYIDEIRVPDLVSPTEWSGFITPDLLAPPSVGERDSNLSRLSWEGVIQYSSANDRKLVLRYGALWGQAVVPGGPLRFPQAKVVEDRERPFFLLDIDSFWAAPGEAEPFDERRLIDLFDDLHEPTRKVFESSITEKLRDEVLRKEVRYVHN